MSAVRERVIRFGREVPMVGVVSEPSHPRPEAPVVIVLNAGFVHRVGPFRMNVALARALAAAGYPAIRIDLTGLGDSPARATSGDLETRVRADIEEAISAALEATNASDAVLYGMCSGAMNAHFAGTDDPRVRGLVLVDPYAWPTTKFRLIRYGSALRERGRLSGFVRRLLDRLVRSPRSLVRAISKSDADVGASSDKVCEDNLTGTIYLAAWPPASRIGNDLKRLFDRGARALMVYTGGMEEYFNYAGQLQDCMPQIDLRSGVIVEHWPESDHLLTVHADRNRLIKRVIEWLDGLQKPARSHEQQPDASALRA